MKTKEELAEEYSELLRRFSAFDPKDAFLAGWEACERRESEIEEIKYQEIVKNSVFIACKSFEGADKILISGVNPSNKKPPPEDTW